MIHEDSLEAYARFHFADREKQVVRVFATNGPLTDRECMLALLFDDPNAVRPTITSLTARKILVEVGGVKCPVTDRTVRVSRLQPPDEIPFTTEEPMSEDPVKYDTPAAPQRPITPADLIPTQMVDPDCRITFQDDPGPGGAFHHYLVSVLGPEVEVTHKDGSVSGTRSPILQYPLHFQKGGKRDCGVNGISQEILLEVVRHRLACFQAGPFPCKENESALNHVVAALEMLRRRTAKRKVRGVEGKSVK